MVTSYHRIGRTGRAGADGIALSFCSSAEREDLRAIEKLIGKKVTLAPNQPASQTGSGNRDGRYSDARQLAAKVVLTNRPKETTVDKTDHLMTLLSPAMIREVAQKQRLQFAARLRATALIPPGAIASPAPRPQQQHPK
jgi:superfamily II DNA/RNA helicase